MQFKKWLEMDQQNGATAGLDQQNKAALKNIGNQVGQALQQGQDPAAAATKASADAAAKISDNAAQGGSIADVGKAAEAAKVLQNTNAPMQMKKKMKKKMKKR